MLPHGHLFYYHLPLPGLWRSDLVSSCAHSLSLTAHPDIGQVLRCFVNTGRTSLLDHIVLGTLYVLFRNEIVFSVINTGV